MGLAQGEKRFEFGTGFLGVTNHERFALPVEPEFSKQSRFVEIVVNPLRRLPRPRVDHEGNLRRPSAGLADLAEDRTQRSIHQGVRLRVGGVENQCVNAGVGQQAGVPAEHPGVGGIVVAVKRLAPPVIARRTPQRGIGLAQNVRVLSQDLGDVVGRAALAAEVREEVKDPHETVSRGGPASFAVGSVRPRASVAGHGVPGFTASRFVWPKRAGTPSRHATATKRRPMKTGTRIPAHLNSRRFSDIVVKPQDQSPFSKSSQTRGQSPDNSG